MQAAAAGVGFEPTGPCGPAVFKTSRNPTHLQRPCCSFASRCAHGRRVCQQDNDPCRLTCKASGVPCERLDGRLDRSSGRCDRLYLEADESW
jgi:hypothetical protein